MVRCKMTPDFILWMTMSKTPYLYNKEGITRYRFVSKRRMNIEKFVEFSPLAIPGFYNLGFGDVTANGSISDQSVSNNGDIIQVLSTVIHIIKDFTLEKPDVRISFMGSTVLRTAVYQQILKSYYPEFKKDFLITTIREFDHQLEEVPFDPSYSGKYKAFIIQRKI